MFKKIILFLLTLSLASSLLLAGCSPTVPNNGQKEQANHSAKEKEKSSILLKNEQKKIAVQKVKLYFSDNQAMFLIPEERDVPFNKDKEKFLQAVVAELIKGPSIKELYLTIPKEAQVKSVHLKNNMAIVDFSRELRTKHWGGSTGETFTIYSLVNTLTEFPEIVKVQILIDGKRVDSLTGHLDISEPLIRDNTLIKK